MCPRGEFFFFLEIQETCSFPFFVKVVFFPPLSRPPFPPIPPFPSLNNLAFTAGTQEFSVAGFPFLVRFFSPLSILHFFPPPPPLPLKLYDAVLLM